MSWEVHKLRSQVAQLKQELATYKEPELQPIMIECTDCGEDMPNDRDDYICKQCRLLIEERDKAQQEAEQREWLSKGVWEEMRQEAMANGYKQAIDTV